MKNYNFEIQCAVKSWGANLVCFSIRSYLWINTRSSSGVSPLSESAPSSAFHLRHRVSRIEYRIGLRTSSLWFWIESFFSWVRWDVGSYLFQSTDVFTLVLAWCRRPRWEANCEIRSDHIHDSVLVSQIQENDKNCWLDGARVVTNLKKPCRSRITLQNDHSQIRLRYSRERAFQSFSKLGGPKRMC